MPIEQIETIMRAPAAALDVLARAIWTDYAAGRLSDTEAQQLAEAVGARHRAFRKPVQGQTPLKVACARRGKTATNEQRRGSPPRPPAARPPHPAPSYL